MAGIGGAFSGGIFGGVTNGVNYVTAQSLGQAVKTEGLTPTVLQQALTLPADSQAHQLAQNLSERLETSLTELGLDASELYHMSSGDQLQLISQVTDKVLSDQDMGELARLVEQAHLTEEQSHGKVDTDNTDNTEMYRLKDDPRSGYKFIGQQRFDNLTIEAKKNGAVILRGTPEIEQHLDSLEASASIFGDVLFLEKMSVYPKFWRNATILYKIRMA